MTVATVRRLGRAAVVCVGLVSLGAPPLAAQAPRVAKVEPPDWWVGHSVNPVRLLLRGSALAGAQVACAPLRCDGVRVSASGTHVFLDVTIPDGTAPGAYPVTLRTATGQVRFPFTVHAPLARDRGAQGIGPDDVLYLIMPDRFANGDVANDDPAKSRGLHDRTDPRKYHGGDLEGVRQRLPYLQSLGVTAIWLTPIVDNVDSIAHRDPVPWAPRGYADYHGYGATDLYAVDEHLGDLAVYRRLVDEAHALGMKVVFDHVANHTGPEHPWATDPPTSTWYNGTPARHLPNNWNVESLADPYGVPAVRDSTLRGWFAGILPDLDQTDPEVERYLIQNTLWWAGTSGLDAIRQDTWPYVPRSFFRAWMAALKRAHPRMTAVGEVLQFSPPLVSFFEGTKTNFDGVRTGVDQLFDFPLQLAARRAFMRGESLRGLAQTLAQDRLYDHPERLVTVADNHDMARLLDGPAATDDGLLLAYTFLLTSRGIPQLYYGDEIGMVGGEEPDNRRDFPGGWPGDSRDAFTAAGRTAREQRVFAHVQALLALRRARPDLRGPDTRSLFVSDDAWVYRRGATLVALNNGAAPVTLRVTGAAVQGDAVVGGCAAPRRDGDTLVLDLAARQGCVF